MPVLGGAARPVVTDVDTPATFSPDGSRIAYVRNKVEERTQRLLVANADGANETTLATRRNDDGLGFAVSTLALGPAWSPDGRSIAVPGWSRSGGFRNEVLLVDTAGGEPRRVGETVWLGISGLSFHPDGRALIVAGIPKGTAFTAQIWKVALPGGELSRITNDSQDYGSVSPSRDGRALAAVQGLSSATLWRRPLEGGGTEQQLTFSSREGLGNLAGSADGSIFYAFSRGREAGVARLDAAGGEPFTLTRPETLSVDVAVSRDGRTVVMRSLLPDGRIVLRAMDRQGGNARVLSELGATLSFALHPDGTWYAARDEKGVWRVPLDGGAPALLVEEPNANLLEFSHGGDRLAYFQSRPDGAGSLRRFLVVVPAAGGAPVAEIELPRGPYGIFRWSSDDRAFIARRQDGDDASLWRLPLDGGPITRIAEFEGAAIWSYWISDDGATLFFTKGEQSSDAVLIENF